MPSYTCTAPNVVAAIEEGTDLLITQLIHCLDQGAVILELYDPGLVRSLGKLRVKVRATQYRYPKLSVLADSLVHEVRTEIRHQWWPN